MNQPITIVTPIPPDAMRGHAKGNWQKKHRLTQDTKDAAYLKAIEACNGSRPNWQRARLHITVSMPDNRKRDLLNVVHGLKGVIDGLVRAGVIQDDSWQHLEVGDIRGVLDRENPGVELTIEPYDTDQQEATQ